MKSRSTNNLARTTLSRLSRNYHSYPDPNEVPIVTSSTSTHKKTIVKDGPEFSSLKRFSMTQPFEGIPVSGGIKNSKAPQTFSSKLSNGLTVASQDLPGSLMSSFAIIVGVGSSFEIQHGSNSNTGVTQMLEQSAFRSTFTRNHDDLIKEVERLGGMVQCMSSRENIMFCIDVFRENAEQALDILADTVLSAKLTPEEVEESRAIMCLQPQELPSEMISRDTVQRAAYQGYPLGQHHYCPVDLVSNIDERTVHEYRAKYLYGENCVLSGAGIDHDTFLKIAESKFSNLISKRGGVIATKSNERKNSKYTGGLVKNVREMKEPFVRLALAFEIGGWHDKDLVTACLLQQLLGGGSSFSAGGPGKGMYSRLYREVLNRNHWVEAAESFVSIHEESGLFGIDGACQPSDLPGLFRVFLDQLLRLTLEPVQPIELSRAKNMLKSLLLMQLESRLVLCEDIAKQMITYNKRDPPSVLCDKIDVVTAEDIQKFAFRMLQSDPSVGCVGPDLSTIPTYEQIKTFTDNYKQHIRGLKSSFVN